MSRAAFSNAAETYEAIRQAQHRSRQCRPKSRPNVSENVVSDKSLRFTNIYSGILDGCNFSDLYSYIVYNEIPDLFIRIRST